MKKRKTLPVECIYILAEEMKNASPILFVWFIEIVDNSYWIKKAMKAIGKIEQVLQ